MSTPRFTEHMAQEILASELYPTRLEYVCVDLFSEIDNEVFLPTSHSWDLSRDAKTRDGAFIACGNEADSESKAVSDLTRLCKFSNVKRFYFCTCRILSEHTIEHIVSSLKSVCPDAERIEVHGRIQLAHLLYQHPQHLEHHYAGELENLRSILLTTADAEFSGELQGMRLALSTQLSDSGAALRRDVIRNLVLFTLSPGSTATCHGICHAVSESLHLPQPVKESYLSPELEQMLGANLIERSGLGYKITEQGLVHVRGAYEQGATELLEGRRLFQEAFEQFANAQLTPEEFNKVWKIVVEGLATLFFRQGQAVIDAFASILSMQTEVGHHADLTTGIRQIGYAITNLNLRSDAWSKALGVAFIDALHDKDSTLFEWLTDRCMIYVCACSLGIEPSAQAQVKSRIKSIDLLLDTDVVLSMLGDAEPNHTAIRDLIRSWRHTGGTVYVTTSVLEEVAYHSWIADNEMKEVWPMITKYDDADAKRLLATTFVRSYRKICIDEHRTMTLRGWREYIGNFKGSKEYDSRNITEVLREEGVEIATEDEINTSMAATIAKEILHEKTQKVPSEQAHRLVHIKDKSDRDGRLVAMLSSHRQQKVGVERSAIIVSSSSYLASVCRRHIDQLGPLEPAMPAAAVAFFIALVPGVSLSLDSLRKLMFDPGFGDNLDNIERRALRLIQASSQHSFPFSRRHQLKQEMYRGMARMAANSGETVEDIEARFAGQDTPEFATLVADTIDALAVSRAEEENRRLQTENEELRMEIEQLKRMATQKRRKNP